MGWLLQKYPVEFRTLPAETNIKAALQEEDLEEDVEVAVFNEDGLEAPAGIAGPGLFFSLVGPADRARPKRSPVPLRPPETRGEFER